MKPEIKEKWLKALRSGEYQQTHKVLKNEYGFCCLGVLCDLHSKENKIEWDKSRNTETYFDSIGSLPKEVIEWSGLPECSPSVNSNYLKDKSNICKEYEKEVPLAVLNDRGMDFKQISDIIEKEF